MRSKLRKTQISDSAPPTGVIIVDGMPMRYWLPEGVPPLPPADRKEDRS